MLMNQLLLPSNSSRIVLSLRNNYDSINVNQLTKKVRNVWKFLINDQILI